MWLMDIDFTVERFHITCLIFSGTYIFVTFSGATADVKTIEIERKFSQIRWIVFVERVQKTFLSTPDWGVPFLKNPPPIIFNKKCPIRCKNHYYLIIIIIPTWILIAINCRFRW